MNKSRTTFYNKRIDELLLLEIKQKSVLKNIVLARIFSFLILVSVVAFSVYQNSITVLWLVLFPLLSFAFFLIKNRKESALLELIQQKSTTNKEELSYLKSDFSVFGNGITFMDSDHEFSHDLDVFGPQSLFQSINRTSSRVSEKKLADLLKFPFANKQIIENRKAAIDELSQKIIWREDFRAKGKLFAVNSSQMSLLTSWSAKDIDIFKSEGLWKIILWGVPMFMISVFTSAYFGFIPWGLAILSASIPLGIVSKKLKTISLQHKKISQFLPVLQQNAQLTQLIEKESFHSSDLIAIKEKLTQKELVASQEIKALADLTQQLDNRSNPVFAIFMNTLFLWDIQYLFRLKKWLLKNETNLNNWFEAVHEMETFLSFATYSFNNPIYTKATISDTTILETTELAHPLLPQNSRIENDFTIRNIQEFVIITGANMAGKSTFLRAVGINLVLANCGAPVCAKSFVFKPTPIFSSMRTSDSLKNNESYFYSELKRLQAIVEKLKRGDELFVILDEILKGTNSKDKAEGSKKFVKQLLKFKVAGIIATHDLSLCSLKEEHDSQIENNYFDVEIENDQLVFDYKLKKGVCSNMNAEFLMKKMGITD